MGRLIDIHALPEGVDLRSPSQRRLEDIFKSKKGPNLNQKGIKTIETKDPFMLKVGVAGYVYVDLIHARTGLIKRHLEFPNLITDAWLDSVGNLRAGSGSDSNAYLGIWTLNGWLGVGTGTATPDVSDTGLQTPTGVRTNSVGGGTSTTGFGASNAYSYRRLVREFTEAQSNGNLTEFGIFSASTAGTMIARQLFKDGDGDPTEIVKTSDDRLRVTWELRLYPPTVDGSGTGVVINAVSYDWTSRAANIGTDTGWGLGSSDTGALNHFGRAGTNVFGCSANNGTGLGSTTSGGITGASQSSAASSSSKGAYTNGTFICDHQVIYEPGVANFSPGVRGFNFQPFASSVSVMHQLLLSAAIPKVNTQRLTLNFQYAFGRHTI